MKILFINTRPANCSIFQGGKMVYEALENNDTYNIQYIEIQNIDVPKLMEGTVVANGIVLEPYDAYIFNYHDLVMRDYEKVLSENFYKLPGLKYALIFEMLPGNPIIRTLDISVRNNDFHRYLVMDPTLVYNDPKFHPFLRPIATTHVEPYVDHGIPIIGSFGFAGSWKGVHDIVIAANKEFDRAILRFNFAHSTYFGGGGVDIASECRAVSKPGVEIHFTQNFMTDAELIHWLSQNTLNAFFYTRDLPGLCACTDQAIMSGRPLAISNNKSFRHIHPYQPPYPEMSLKDTIEFGTANILKMQDVWSYEQCQKRFIEIMFQNNE